MVDVEFVKLDVVDKFSYKFGGGASQPPMPRILNTFARANC